MNIFDFSFDELKPSSVFGSQSERSGWQEEEALFYTTYKQTVLEKAASEKNRPYYEQQFEKCGQHDSKTRAQTSKTDSLPLSGEDSLVSVGSEVTDSSEKSDGPKRNNAALLGPLWFLYHKMYKECALWFWASAGFICFSLLCWAPHRKRRKNDPRACLLVIAFHSEGMLRESGTEWLFKSLCRKISQGFLEWPGYRFRMSFWGLAAWCLFYVGVMSEGVVVLKGEPLFVRLVSLACFHGFLGAVFSSIHVCERRRAKRYKKVAADRQPIVHRRTRTRKK